jgi:hypothetical protein
VLSAIAMHHCRSSLHCRTVASSRCETALWQCIVRMMMAVPMNLSYIIHRLLPQESHYSPTMEQRHDIQSSVLYFSPLWQTQHTNATQVKLIFLRLSCIVHHIHPSNTHSPQASLRLDSEACHRPLRDCDCDALRAGAPHKDPSDGRA